MRIELTEIDRTLEQLHDAALKNAEAVLNIDAQNRMEPSRAVIDRVVGSDVGMYGVNTGFGRMASKRIACDQSRELQILNPLCKTHMKPKTPEWVFSK
jgi:histidine ammonia-lyase